MPGLILDALIYAVTAGAGLTLQGLANAAIIAGSTYYSIDSRRRMKKRMAELRNQGRTFTIRDPAASRPVVYGTQRVGGVMVFAHTAGTNNEFLHLIITLAGHEVNAINTIYFNETAVTLDGSGNAIGTYAGFARVKKYLGTDSQTVGTGALASEAPAIWTANHRLRGVACLEVRLKWDADKFPTGIPNISAVVEGKKLYDPRTSTTAFSANPALVLRDYLSHVQYGIGATDAEIDDDAVTAAANICDEDVTLADSSTEDRYTCNGIVDTSVSPAEAIEDILTSMAGWCIFSAGKWRINAGAHQAASATFTLDDLRGPISVQTSSSQRDTANGVKAVFISPTNQWQPADLPPIRNGTYEVEDGSVSRTFTADATTDVLTLASAANLVTATALKFTTDGTAPGGLAAGTVYYWIPVSSRTGKLATDRTNAIAGTAIDITDAGSGTHTARFGEVIWRDIDLPFTTSATMAQRLMKSQLERERQDIAVKLPLKLSGLKVQAGDIVALIIDRYGWNSKLFEVIEWRFAVEESGGAPSLGVDLTLRETASGVWDWNSGEETTVDLAPNTDLPDPLTVATPAGLTVLSNASTAILQPDGTYVPRLKVSWTAPANIFVTSGGKVHVEYKKSADADWTVWAELRGDATFDFITDVESNVAYDVRIRFSNTEGVRSAYATSTNTTISVDGTAPATPTGLTASASPASIALDWSDNTEDDFDVYEVYRDTNSDFSTEALVWRGRASGWTDFFTALSTTYHYRIRALDRSKNASAKTTGVSATPDDANGADGNFKQYVFQRAATEPATPTGNGIPTGWSDSPPAADGNPLWMSVALQTADSVLIGSWSTPIQLDGSDGDSLTIEYSVDGATNWHSTFATGDKYMRQRIGSGAWSDAIKIVGEDGADGQDGEGVIVAHSRSTDFVTWDDGVQDSEVIVLNATMAAGPALVTFRVDIWGEGVDYDIIISRGTNTLYERSGVQTTVNEYDRSNQITVPDEPGAGSATYDIAVWFNNIDPVTPEPAGWDVRSITIQQ